MGHRRRGYQVGNFPALWSEWNDKYRDTVRDYWKAGDVPISELAYRLTGSSDLYQETAAVPTPASTSSPPTTGLPCRIWSATTRSTTRPTARTTGTVTITTCRGTTAWRTEDPKIIVAREQTKRNLMATLLPRRVPMLAHGDEIGRTQQGNNVYAQDNEIGWVDWNLDERKRAFLAFTRDLIAVRDAHPDSAAPASSRGAGSAAHRSSWPGSARTASR